MNRFFKALVPTLLLTELALISSATAVWAILSEMHAGKYVVFGAEILDVIGAVLLSVVIFRMAWRSEGRMNLEKAGDN
ncbi:hypothetical protein [Hyphomonas johnsonii]|uniref:Uncharacterized protein n=1 Tax=Hyphomonas johnsonii MHS-2 TaxID=1280950 RepID=A0A059FM82_9PROT|nr:hypothetical protein [Hyphomonas johnsonii]KCZ91722.1 hypothetical protein HJO_11412 [Hyphomonas johnsonii MHS-2]